MVTEQQLETIDVNINMGPQHPSTHGVFRMVLTVDGERVVDVQPHITYIEPPAGERLPDPWDSRQGPRHQDRPEYLPLSLAEQPSCMAVEKLAGIAVPERS